MAARPGAERPYERNKYPQTTPVSRRKNFYFIFFKKIWKSLRIRVTGDYAARTLPALRLNAAVVKARRFVKNSPCFDILTYQRYAILQISRTVLAFPRTNINRSKLFTYGPDRKSVVAGAVVPILIV